jgi:hypothetical protein
MKENDNLEKHFRDELKHLEAGPPDGAKSSIEKHLLDSGMLKDTNERRGGLWMFVLLALLVITPLVLLVTKNTKQNASIAVASNNSIKENTNYINDENTRLISSKDNRNLNAQSKKTAAKNNTAATHNDSKISYYSNIKLKEKNSAKIKVENEFAVLIPDKTETKKEINAKNSMEMPESLVIENRNDDQQGASTDLTASIEKDLINPESPNSTTDEEPAVKDSSELLENKSVNNPTVKEQSILPKIEKIKPVIAFDFSGAPNFSTIKYGNGSYNYKTYIEESRQSEREIPSFTAAFGIIISFEKFITETGLKHSSLTSDFSYSETYISIDTSASHWDSLTWVHVEDTVNGETHYIATNRISFIEVPALIGYRINANRFEIEIKTGVMMSIITSANTTIFSLNTGNVVKYDELEDSPYRKKHWSAIGTVQILYDLNERFSAFVQPSFKYGLNSLFKDNYTVTKRIQSVAAGIGFRVRL